MHVLVSLNKLNVCIGRVRVTVRVKGRVRVFVRVRVSVRVKIRVSVCVRLRPGWSGLTRPCPLCKVRVRVKVLIRDQG